MRDRLQRLVIRHSGRGRRSSRIPDVSSSKAANAAALGRKLKQKTPPAVVGHGHGPERQRCPGCGGEYAPTCSRSAATSRRRRRMGSRPTARPSSTRSSTTTRRRSSRSSRRRALQNLIQPADVAKLPRRPGLLALDPGSMLLVVLGQRLPRTRRAGPAGERPEAPAGVRPLRLGPGAPTSLRPLAPQDHVPADGADRARAQLLPGHAARRHSRSRQYWIDRQGGHNARSGSSSTTATRTGAWRRPTGTGRRRSPTRASAHDLGGREFDLYYSGSHLHMVVLRAHGATLLGRQHAARRPLERDDAGDRQGPQTANKREVDSGAR